jgi:O-antigen/teichoic acid export membrane protein
MTFKFKLNSGLAVVEVMTMSLGLFALYKFILQHLGVKELGLWSIVLATTSLARFGDVGASAGLSRYVAVAMADGDDSLARDYIETAFLANLGLYSAICAIVALPMWFGIKFVVSAGMLPEARSLIPYTLVSFVFLNLSTVVLSGLIGLQRSYLKSAVTIVSLVVQLTLAFVLVPKIGLPGVAISQVCQYIVTLITGWIIIGKFIKPKSPFGIPVKLNTSTLKVLLGFGVKLQAASTISLLFEPAIKFVMSATCGLAVVGYYEMASRYVFQVRSVVAAPIQTLLPAFAHLDAHNPSEIVPLYDKSVSFAIVLAGLALSATAVASPLLCILWIGHYNGYFVSFAVLLCFGWFCNAIATAGYLLGVGRGEIRWNLAGHIAMTGGGAILAFIVGKLTGSIGLVATSSAMVGACSLFSMFMNCRSAGIHPFPGPRTVYGNVLAGIKEAAKHFRNFAKTRVGISRTDATP